MLALDACYWLHKTISLSLSRFGDDRRCDVSRWPASQKILCTLWCCVYMYIFISEWKWSVVHISICFNKKIRPFIVIFDGLYIPGKEREREQRARWAREGDPYCIVSYNNFIFIDNFISFCKRCLFSVILMNKWIFFQAREKQTERAQQLQHNGNFIGATEAAINPLSCL